MTTTHDLCRVLGCWLPERHSGFHGVDGPDTPLTCQCAEPRGVAGGQCQSRACGRLIVSPDLIAAAHARVAARKEHR